MNHSEPSRVPFSVGHLSSFVYAYIHPPPPVSLHFLLQANSLARHFLGWYKWWWMWHVESRSSPICVPHRLCLRPCACYLPLCPYGRSIIIGTKFRLPWPFVRHSPVTFHIFLDFVLPFKFPFFIICTFRQLSIVQRGATGVFWLLPNRE
jgi:hypothetical protein